MTPDETLAALLVLRNRVPDRQVFPDRAMAVAWHADLAKYPSEAAIRCAESWDGDKFPSAGEFMDAVQKQARVLAVERADAQRAEMELGPGGTRCTCDGGFVWLSEKGHGVVERCPRCTPEPLHPKTCACMTCYYGEGRARAIREGRDGVFTPSKPNVPLQPAMEDF